MPEPPPHEECCECEWCRPVLAKKKDEDWERDKRFLWTPLENDNPS